MTLEDFLMRARTQSGDPAANANTIGGFPSLSGTSTSAKLYSKMASSISGKPRLQAKCRAVWPSLLCASKREIMELLSFPEGVLARRSLHAQTKRMTTKMIKVSYIKKLYSSKQGATVENTDLTPLRSLSETS